MCTIVGARCGGVVFIEQSILQDPFMYCTRRDKNNTAIVDIQGRLKKAKAAKQVGLGKGCKVTLTTTKGCCSFFD